MKNAQHRDFHMSSLPGIRLSRYTVLITFTLLLFTARFTDAETYLDSLRREFAELRLGMFLHFGMNTFHEEGNGKDYPNRDPANYDPYRLDPRQWVSAARQAGMKFIVLTAKHHDGFCLWDTRTTEYKCTNSRVPERSRKDVVALFVEACRDSGIWPGIYYSVQDRSDGAEVGSGEYGNSALYINSDNVLGDRRVEDARAPRESIDLVLTQIRELLTNYGHIPFFVDDGWAWSMGHTIIPYQEFKELLYEISPNTLFSEHEGLFYPWHQDVIYYENSKGVWPPENQIYASWLSNKMGGAWYWLPSDEGKTPGSVDSFISNYLNRCEPAYCNAAPNFGPNREGLLQPSYVEWCRQLGQAWSPDRSRPPLPEQPPHMEYVITAVGAEATSNASGSRATNVMDGVSDGGFADHYEQYLWQSSGNLPQSVTVDLGDVYNDIEMVNYLPRQIAREDANGRDSSGTITEYIISWSENGRDFREAVLTDGNGTWKDDVTMKYALFEPVRARYMRLEAVEATGREFAIISELDFGGHLRMPYTGEPVSAVLPEQRRYGPRLKSVLLNGNTNLFHSRVLSTGNIFDLSLYRPDGRRMPNPQPSRLLQAGPYILTFE